MLAAGGNHLRLVEVGMAFDLVANERLARSSKRSTSLSRSRVRQSRAARSSSRGAKCDGQILVVTNTSARLTPEARSPSPTSRSLSYVSRSACSISATVKLET